MLVMRTWVYRLVEKFWIRVLDQISHVKGEWRLPAVCSQYSHLLLCYNEQCRQHGGAFILKTLRWIKAEAWHLNN